MVSDPDRNKPVAYWMKTEVMVKHGYELPVSMVLPVVLYECRNISSVIHYEMCVRKVCIHQLSISPSKYHREVHPPPRSIKILPHV